MGCLKEPDNGQKNIFKDEDCVLLLVRGLGSSVSLKWQSNLEHSTVQWVRPAALLGRGRIPQVPLSWPAVTSQSTRNPLFVRGKFWWGKNILLAGEVQLFPLCLRIRPKVLCCCPYCFCGHFKSLICDPQKGLRILDLNLGWGCTAGSELLHLQVMSHGPAWCHTPQCQTYEPFTTLCLDHSSPNPASLLPLCSL